MTGNDMPPSGFVPKGKDVMIAFALLTRLPLPYPAFDPVETRPAAHAAWAYPLVGIAVGGIAAAVAWITMVFGLPAPVAAMLALLSMVLVTGAMHEDGLADCADGFWGGWTVARRLEIMKDSHIGAYGVIALILSLCLRWYLMSEVIRHGGFFWALVAAAVLSRAAMVWMMSSLVNARQSGLSEQTGRPPQRAALFAVAIALGCGLVATPSAFIWMVLICAGTTLGLRRLAKAKIGGQTGDVLGATQQIIEICALMVCLTAL